MIHPTKFGLFWSQKWFSEIIALCHEGQIELLSSEVLLYEGEQNPLPIRKEHTLAVLSEAKIVINVTEIDIKRATTLTTFDIKPLDALHLAVAETGGADFFCTCDDRVSAERKKKVIKGQSRKSC